MGLFSTPDPPAAPQAPTPTQTFEPTPEEVAASRAAIAKRQLSRSRMVIGSTPQGDQQVGTGLRIS